MSFYNFKCPACASEQKDVFFDLKQVPVICNQLCESEDIARGVQKGDIGLVFCENCGLIYNNDFTPHIINYDAQYDNALHFSPLFKSFAKGLAERLVNTYNLRNQKVFEIGCGDGYFLNLMIESGVASGKGFDPSAKEQGHGNQLSENIVIVSENFRPGAKQIDEPYKALLCRHVLEHIPEPVAFLQEIRKAIGNRDCVVYFEVPNTEWVLQSRSLWDVIYEHVTHWTKPSLAGLFRKCGFEPIAISSDYGDQFLMIEARPVDTKIVSVPSKDDVAKVGREVEAFSRHSQQWIEGWRNRLRDLAEKGQTAALWGAGSKGVTFVNIIGDDATAIACLVDVSTRKTGKFAAGTALQIVAPEALKRLRPDLIIVANPIYTDEIRKIVNALDLDPAFESISR